MPPIFTGSTPRRCSSGECLALWRAAYPLVTRRSYWSNVFRSESSCEPWRGKNTCGQHHATSRCGLARGPGNRSLAWRAAALPRPCGRFLESRGICSGSLISSPGPGASWTARSLTSGVSRNRGTPDTLTCTAVVLTPRQAGPGRDRSARAVFVLPPAAGDRPRQPAGRSGSPSWRTEPADCCPQSVPRREG